MKKIFVFIFCIILSLSMHCQSLLFVSHAGSDNRNGQSWTAAKRTIGGALSVATSGTVICLMVGDYTLTEELTIPAGVCLKGGFPLQSAGTDTTQQSYPGGNVNWTNTNAVSRITGDGAHRLFTVQPGARIESCVLRYGYSNLHGGGVLLNGGIASYCVITNCVAHNSQSSDAKGGGVYMQNNAQLLNCVLCFNRADNGYAVAGNSGEAVNNTITLNYGTNCGTVTDYDGNVYATVTIGPQCWMSEHLRTTHFADGTPVTQSDTMSLTTPHYYSVGSSGQETHAMGLLYNVQAARRGSQDLYSETAPSGIQGLCPTGWHLPSNAEFEQMLEYLAYDNRNICGYQSNHLGKTLAAQSYWNSSSTVCAVGNGLNNNNYSGFNAQPAGYFNGSFADLYSKVCLWTSSRSDNVSSRCTYRFLQYDLVGFGQNYFNADYACSIRCVKDW